jgi:hypothetical protein
MRLTLTLLILFSSLASYSQVREHVVGAVGVYKEINITNTTRVIQLLVDTKTNISGKAKLIDSIEQNPNSYNPPVLFVLSYELYHFGNKINGMFWFYLAQLRARYDVNRCADKTANASDYDLTFGPPINAFSSAHLDTLTQVIVKVIAFEKSNEENYDQRWINLTGMDAMSAGLGEKLDKKQLSLPKSEWPEIKKKTIEDYSNGFQNFILSRKKQ